MHTRAKGQISENIALQRYINHGYVLIQQNFTMQGGEIDIIVENTTDRVYIEVKGVDAIDDLHGFITTRKLSRIRKTISYYELAHPTSLSTRVDVIFIKGGAIYEHYESISF